MAPTLFARLLVFLDILENHPDDRTVRRIQKTYQTSANPPRWQRPIDPYLKAAGAAALKGDRTHLERSLSAYLAHTQESGVELACRHLCNKKSLPQHLSAS